jgi:Putative capsular polysaccharide synthesis protein
MPNGLRQLSPAAARGRARLGRIPRKLISAVRYRLDAPILIYQMGKVGSSTVYAALDDQALPVPVEHVHLLANHDAIEAAIRATYPDPSTTLEQLDRGRRVRESIDRQPDVRWNVITLVRDPVVRNVSAFFQSLHELVPEARDGDVPLSVLGTAFTEKFGQNAPLKWFQEQLTPVFGIDPYATPFPHAQGFQILEGERARLLILRNEDLTDCLATALQAFLGIKIRDIPDANESGVKWYGPMQKKLLTEFQFPPEYLDTMYSSEYAQHFYTPAEIARSRARFGGR